MNKTAFLILIALCKFTFAQTNIEGTIRDAETAIPLTNASITISNNKKFGCSSDSKGHFIVNIPRKSDSLIISYLGYKTEKRAIKDMKNTLLIEMRPAEIIMAELTIFDNKESSLTQLLSACKHTNKFISSQKYSFGTLRECEIDSLGKYSIVASKTILAGTTLVKDFKTVRRKNYNYLFNGMPLFESNFKEVDRIKKTLKVCHIVYDSIFAQNNELIRRIILINKTIKDSSNAIAILKTNPNDIFWFEKLAETFYNFDFTETFIYQVFDISLTKNFIKQSLTGELPKNWVQSMPNGLNKYYTATKYGIQSYTKYSYNAETAYISYVSLCETGYQTNYKDNVFLNRNGKSIRYSEINIDSIKSTKPNDSIIKVYTDYIVARAKTNDSTPIEAQQKTDSNNKFLIKDEELLIFSKEILAGKKE